MSGPGKNDSYIKGIDGLRALAVLSVMIFHLEPSMLPGGFSGVDVFFVISGFVVSASLAKQSGSGFLKFTLDFYSRRITRIFPALVVCLVISSLLTALFIPESWLSQSTSSTGLYAFFGISNLALIWTNDGYFAARTDFNPFTHTWSLGVEEQFYLIFPFLFFFWVKYKDNRLWGRVVVALLIAMAGVSLVYARSETSANPDNAYYLLPCRFWELASGALLYQFQSYNSNVVRTARRWMPLFMLGVLLIGAGLYYSRKDAFPFPWALLPVFGSLLIIFFLSAESDPKSLLARLFEINVLVYIGKISYSLYLWHWPIYVLFRWTVGLEDKWYMVLAVVLTFVMASISYRYVEIPFIRYRSRTDNSSFKIVLLGCAGIVCAFGLAKLVFTSQADISLSVTKNKQLWYPYKWSEEVQHEGFEEFKGRKIHVLGDSHASAYTTMLHSLSKKYGVEVIQYSTGGCGVANLILPIPEDSYCQAQTEKSLLEIEKTALSGDIIFLASLRVRRLGEQWNPFPLEEIMEAQSSARGILNRKLALEEAEGLIERFSKLSVHVIIDAPKPVYRFPSFRCSDWFNASNPVCDFGGLQEKSFLEKFRSPTMMSLSKLGQKFPELVIWDPFPILCSTSICSPTDKGKPLYFDGDHLSAHGNRVLFPSFDALVRQIWLN